MREINDACSTTNKTVSGSYNYYLQSRVDGYAVILREKSDGTEYLFRVVLDTEHVDTIWAAATSQSYLRPDQMSSSIKKYVVNKMNTFLKANNNIAKDW